MANKEDVLFTLKAVDEIAAVFDKLHAKVNGLTKDIDQVNKKQSKGFFSDFGNKMSKYGDKVSSFGAQFTAGVSLPLFFAGKSAVEVASQFQTMDVALTTMLGSADKAKQLRTELTNFAAKTPFQIDNIGQTAQQLLAVGVSQEKLIPTLQSLGDVAAGLNIPLERIVMNYGQVRTQNKLTGREMKDFLASGIPLMDQLAKQMNVKKSAVPNLISKGKVSFDQVEKAFKNMSGAGGKFENLMQKISNQTFTGKFSNFVDQISILSASLGEALIPDLEKLMEYLSQLLDWFSKLDPHTKKIIARFALFAAVLGPVMFYVGMMMQGFGAIISLVGGISLATLGWVAAIAAVVAAGIYLYKNWDKIKKFFLDFWEKSKIKVLDFVNLVGPKLSELWDGPLFKLLKFTNPLYWLYRLGKLIYDNWNTVKTHFTKMWDTPLGRVAKFLSPIHWLIDAADLIKNNWGGIKDFFSNLWSDLLKGLNVFIETVKNDFKSLGTIADFGLSGHSGYLFSNSTTTDQNGNKSQNTFGNAFKNFITTPSLLLGGPMMPILNSIAMNQIKAMRNTTKVTVDFQNVPKGADVKQSGTPIDLNLGFAGF